MSLAKSYAKALWASGSGQGDVVFDELTAFLTAVQKDALLSSALFGAVLSANEKQNVLEGAFERLKLSTATQEFLLLLARKRRLGFLSEILSTFDTIRWEAAGGVRGDVRSAEPLSESDLKDLAQSFGQRLGKKVSFRAEVDPRLLAGLSVTLQGVTYDGTLRSQLDRLKERVTAMKG